MVTYSNYTVKEAGKNKTVGTFEVRGKAWHELLGGEHFDLAVTPFCCCLLAPSFVASSLWV